MPPASVSTDLPLRRGPPEEFALVRKFFREAAFDDDTLCRILVMADMSDLGRVQWDKARLDGIGAPLRWCLQVFLRGLPAAEPESRIVCGEEALAAFVSLGLLRPAR